MKNTAGIYTCGCHLFLTEFMKILEVDIDISLDVHLLKCDKIKLRKSIMEHDHAHMATRKDTEHAKIRTELGFLKDIAKNMEYGSQICYKEDDGKNDEKKEGLRRPKGGRRMG